MLSIDTTDDHASNWAKNRLIEEVLAQTSKASLREIVDSNLQDMLNLDIVDQTYEYFPGDDKVEPVPTNRTVQVPATAESIRRNQQVFGSRLGEGLAGELFKVANDRVRDEIGPGDVPDPEGDAMLAAAYVAAVGKTDEVVARIHQYARELTDELWADNHSFIASLPKERQAAYKEVLGRDTQPASFQMVAPMNAQVNAKIRFEDGTEKDLPSYPTHILVTEDGRYPCLLNDLEQEVLQRETSRDTHLGWYRNPTRSGGDALTVAYEMGERWRGLKPDFLVFDKASDGTTQVSIIDPHSSYLDDWLYKLKGLAAYAEKHGDKYKQILALDEFNDTLRCLDLKEASTRKAIREHSGTGEDLYTSAVSFEYR